MRIVLMDPPGWQKHGYNLGLAYLSGALLKAGIEVRVLDLNQGVMQDEEVETFLSEFQPQVIGISIKTASYKSGIEMARKTRRMCPEAVHIAGGPHVSLAYEEFLRENREFDVAFVGESERSIVEFCQRLEANSSYDDVHGLAYMGAEGRLQASPVEPEEDLESLPFPEFEPFYNVDPSRGPYHLLSSRGCPYPCIFCCVQAISGNKWRFRSPGNIIAELEQAVARYGIKEFEVDDDNFTLDLDRAKEFCRQLQKRKLRLRWFCPNGIRADRLDAELASLMADTGCHSVAFGIESANQHVLQTVKKGQKLQDIEKAVGYLKKVGIHTMGYFIIGLPGSTFEAEMETMKYEKRIGLDDSLYNLFVPYPRTEGWEWVERNGTFLRDYKSTYHFCDANECVFETNDFSRKDRIKAYRLSRDKELSVRGLTIREMEEKYLEAPPENILIIELASFGGVYDDAKNLFPSAHFTLLDIPNGNQYGISAGPLTALREIERWAIRSKLTSRVPLAWQLFHKLRGMHFDMIILPRTLRHIILALLLRSRLRIIYFPQGTRVANLSLYLLPKLMAGTLLYRASLILPWMVRCLRRLGYRLRRLKMPTGQDCRLKMLGLRMHFLESRRGHLLARIERMEKKPRRSESRLSDWRTIADGRRIELDELRVVHNKIKGGNSHLIAAPSGKKPEAKRLLSDRLPKPVAELGEIVKTFFVLAIFGLYIIWLIIRRTIGKHLLRRM